MPGAPDENVTGGRKVQPPRRLHSHARRPWFSGPKVIRSPADWQHLAGNIGFIVYQIQLLPPRLTAGRPAAGLAGTFGSSTL
jgi:hypothetical protein